MAERGGDRTLSGPEAGVWAHIQTHRDPTTPSPAGPGRLSQETSWKMASYHCPSLPSDRALTAEALGRVQPTTP